MNTRKPKILAIGGGTGLPKVMWGLSQFHVYLQAGVTVTDNGGDAGQFRRIDDAPSFGDYARSVVPLCAHKSLVKNFERKIPYRGSVHKVRNVVFHRRFNAFDRDFRATVDATPSWLGMKDGNVLPTTLENAHLYARLENGTVIEGETNIDKPMHDGSMRIIDLWLEPVVKPNPAFIRSIYDADMIVFSPGDFYTSVIASLLPVGIMEALRRSTARKVFMLNMMTKWGETHDYGLKDFMESLIHHIGADIVHDVMVNSTIPSLDVLKRYEGEKAKWIAVDPKSRYHSRVIREPLLLPGERIIRHDPRLIGEAFERRFPGIFVREESERIEAVG